MGTEVELGGDPHEYTELIAALALRGIRQGKDLNPISPIAGGHFSGMFILTCNKAATSER